jgi:hypothetical protein
MRAACVASVAIIVAVVLAGCATSTRVMHMGPLVTGQPLVTLVVSEDRMVVRRECIGVPSIGPALGCHLWRRVTLPGSGPVQLVTIVRYTDSMPSPLSLEIDAHELCHAIAALQPIEDPCHADNGGIVESASARLRGD